jgi:serine phosphatase RsbU (regulator of sigma subunit)/tetratricopeptide (TPR) repeat protein
LTSTLSSQNREAISDRIRFLQQQNISDSARIEANLTLASEYSAYKNDSSFYYLDQVFTLLKTAKNPKAEIDAQYLLAMTHYVESNYEKSQFIVNQCIKIARTQGDKDILAKCYNLLGAIHFNTGNYEEAINGYENKLLIVWEVKDTVSVIETLYNLSLIYNAEGNYYKSLENNYTGLTLAEKTLDAQSMMIAYQGLGIAYHKIKDSKKAIIFLKKALQLAITYLKPYEQSGIMIDLANVYQEISDHEKAEYYYKRARDIAKRNGDRLVESIAITGRGNSLVMLNEYESAAKLFKEAIHINQEINYPKGLAENYLHLAECNNEMGNSASSKKLALNALDIFKRIGEKKEESKANRTLSEIYEALNNADSAYYYYKRHIKISDSLQNKASLRKIASYELEHQKQKLEKEGVFRDKMAKIELAKQKKTRNIISVAALVILLLVLFVYRNYKLKQKINIEIGEQKKEIEHKNKDIVDSINYSKGLQEAVLATEDEIRKILPQSFLIYHPKDIVSGDFYFIEAPNDTSKELHVALADCTGQGVPGAFMSIIGHNILKQSLNEKNLTDPASRLEYLNKSLKIFLRNEEDTSQGEGMDISYCFIKPEEKTVEFCGANQDIWLSSRKDLNLSDPQKKEVIDKCAQGRTLFEIKGNKQSIGSFERKESFETRKFHIEQGDTLYLFSDGYANQFGGPENKKFTYSRLAAILNSVAESDPANQKKAVNDALSEWKKNNEQTDDICILGIRF